MASVAIAKAYARRINRGDVTLEEVKTKVPSDMYDEIVNQLEIMAG
jgi:hypothetical protein